MVTDFGALNHPAIEGDKNTNAYVKEYEPIQSTSVSEIVDHIIKNSGLKQKGSQLDKIINLYAGESNRFNSVLLRKSIRSGVYNALGLEGGGKLEKKSNR